MTKESSVFFPEVMKLVELVVPHETSYHLIRSLANADLVHMIDHNVDARSQEKRYTDDFMRCEDADRSLRYIQSQLERYDKLPDKPGIVQFRMESDQRKESYRELLTQIEEVDTQLRDRIESTRQLETQVKNLTASLETIRFYLPLMQEQEFVDTLSPRREDGGALELQLMSESQSFLFSVSGVMDPKAMRRMFVTMYRASRGNIVMSQGTDETGKKGFFAAWFQTELLRKKVVQIALSYGANVFEFSVEENEVKDKEAELVRELSDLQDILRRSYADNGNFLTEIKDSFWYWRLFFSREVMIIKNMDYADFSTISDRAVYRGWIPHRRYGELAVLLNEATENAGSATRIACRVSDGEEAPPTWIETNEFTAPFQTLCDAYGFADHDEVNAGAFYGMYPFLFGVMFGDIGHSLIFLAMALGLIVMAPRLKQAGGEMIETVLGYRYFFLSLALAGVYNGFVYNECFGIPIDLFGSCYKEVGHGDYEKTGAGIYPFGLDPVWMFKDNELIYTNSLKMKISVVLGITMMVFGMFLSLIKQIRRKAWIHLLLGWIPQMMYLCSFFVYMVALILKKWCTKVEPGDAGVNIIQVLISMMLSPTELVEEQRLYPGQQGVQNAIALIFVSSIPLMLIVKPIVEMCIHGVGNGILESFVITLIEVIEFTLSALSHTASFLRLWALSLAHSQLSHVLYDQLFILTMKMGPLPFFIGVAAWVAGTVAILLGMESFSSLLHGIRLMWVEFSSKFYSGTGYEFLPLSFKREFSLVPERLAVLLE